jgi:hypothetical protein
LKSNIFIPKKIKVGFQKRSDTYTNQLAYVIYYDNKGVLRKETSWRSWRDASIEPLEFDNVPTDGFVLNKKVGGNNYSWNPRQTYVRVYDPRNFEFEITVPNLLFILENGDSYKGKGLSDKFVYGWDGKDLVLVPTSSPDYKELEEFNNVMFSNNKITAKDLKIGATYKKKDNEEYVYLGRYDYYWNETVYVYKNEEYNWRNLPHEAKTYNYREMCHNHTTKLIEKTEKRHWFYAKNPTYRKIESYKSVSDKFIQCTNESCVDNYAELFDELERNSSYSPIDNDKDEYVKLTLEEFKEECRYGIEEDYYKRIDFISNKTSMRFKMKEDVKLLYNELEYSKRYSFENVKLYTEEEVYNTFEPSYRNVYLRNGKLYKKEKR